MAVALLAGSGGERAVARLLARWRRRCSEATPKRFSHRAGFGLAWGGLEVLGIAVFAGIALLLGWLLLPALATPRLTLVIVVAAITQARLVLDRKSTRLNSSH